MFLARKIKRSKWEKEGFADGEIPADAITADLRTGGNSLSFWKCGDGTAEKVREAALALAAGATRVDKLEIVWISEDELHEVGLAWRETEGRTPVRGLKNLHVDLQNLDYVRLGKVAGCVATAISDCRYHLISRVRVRKLLALAVLEERVELEALSRGIQEEVCRLLED